jgi:hypothetical protein
MKYLFAMMAALATISAAAALPLAKQNYTPRPDVKQASCWWHCNTDSYGNQTCHWNCY